MDDLGGRRATFLLARTLADTRRHRSAPGGRDDSRLYERDGTRLEAHLGRRSDGRPVVLLVSLGPREARLFTVGGADPWQDFERQAGLTGARWGVCRDVTAGL